MATSTSHPPRSEDEPPPPPQASAAPPAAEPPAWEDEPAHEPGHGTARTIVEWVVVVAGAVVVALVIKTFVVQAFYIPSESMEPTLLEYDRVLVNKMSYRLHGVNRGDVVVFEDLPATADGNPVKDVIKRVVGLPGERVSFAGDRVLIDGRPLDEPYLPAGTVTTTASRAEAFQQRQCLPEDPCVVPEGAVWVMGDNRSNSKDSRYRGPVPFDDIIGRSFVVVWPLNRVGGL